MILLNRDPLREQGRICSIPTPKNAQDMFLSLALQTDSVTCALCYLKLKRCARFMDSYSFFGIIVLLKQRQLL